MATNKNLKWQITEQDHPEWVKFLDSGGSLVSSISGEGDTQLNVVIDDGAEGDDTHGFIYVRCISCKSQKSAQSIEVCRCVCNCETFSITGMSGNIPSSGMTRGRQIGTYELSGSCSEDKIDVRINGSGLTLSNGNILLANDIPENREPSGITYTVTSSIVGGSPCENNQFPLTQEGIVCDCEKVLNYARFNDIPQSGVASGGQVGTYELNTNYHCPSADTLATISGDGMEYTLRFMGGGKIRLPNGKGISANTGSNGKTFHYVVSYSGDECVTSAITQSGVTCDCNKVLSSVTFNDIPQEGFPNGAPVGSYGLNSDYQCPTDTLSAILSGESTEFVLNMSGGVISLKNNENIPANTGTQDKYFNLTVKYGNNTCDSESIIQEGTGCGCGNFRNFTVRDIPNSGVTRPPYEIGTYTLDDGCLYSDYTLVETDNSFTLSVSSNNKVYITSTVPENTATTQNTYRVELKYKNSSCGTGRDIIQPGKDCACSTLHNVTFDNVPSSGVSASSNFEIGTYSTDSNACEYTFIEVNNAFTMSGNNSTGKIIVTSDIPENSGYGPIDYTVVAKYGNDECVRSGITQDGSFVCDCESIGLMVTLMKTSFPKTGTTAWEDEGAGQGWVLVASGDTHGCGYLSGVSDSYLLEEPKVKIVELGNYQYNFFIKVKSSTTPNDESAGLKVYFRKKDEAQFDDNCYKIFYITQSNDYCECTNFPVIEKDYSTIQSNFITVNVPFDGDSILISTDDIYNSLQCYDIELSTRTSWININDFKKYLTSAGDYHENTWVNITSNPSTARTGAFFIECYVDRQGIPYITSPGNVIYNKGYGGKLCKVITVNVEQEAHVECSCENSGFNDFDIWPHTNPYLKEYDACKHENVSHSFKLNCGELAYRFKDGVQPDWITVSIDNVNKKMYLNITKNEGEERNTSILFYPIIDGVECDTNPFEYQIKQTELECDDCDTVKSYITTYPVDECMNSNYHYFAKYPDSDCLCGTISAVTCDVNGYVITNPDVVSIEYPHFSKSYNPKATFTENDTGSDRHFYFKVFVVDNEGHMVPNDDCYKIVHVCQAYHTAEECACSAYTSASVSQNGYTSGLTAGTGEHKVGKLTLSRRSESMPIDCLEIVVSSTHAEIAECWLDSNDEINVRVVDELADDVVHPATVDINIFDTSRIDPDTQGHVKCSFPLMRIELSITPNRPKPTN